MPNSSWFHLSFLLSCIGTLALSQTMTLAPRPLYDSSNAAQGLVRLDALQDQLLQTPSALAKAFALRDYELFVWSSVEDDAGKSHVAMMQMETLEKEKVINMQRFSNLLTDVDCTPSQVVLTFKTQAAFKAAFDSWTPLNSDQISHLALFTNWKGCHTDTGNLKPFHLTGVSFDSTKWTATFSGSETDWKTAARTFTMSIGKYSDEESSSHLTARSSIFTKAFKEVKKDFTAKGFKGVTSKIAEGIKKGLKTKIVDIDQKLLTIALDKSYTATKYLSTPGAANSSETGLSSSVTCTACGAHGKFVFEIIMKVTLGATQTTMLSVKTQNFGISLGLAMSARSNLPESISNGRPLFEYPIPGVGIKIPEISEIGLIASLDYSVSISDFKGDLNIVQNIVVDIPNGAGFELQLLGSQEGRSRLRGDWGPVAQSTRMQAGGSGSGEFAVGLGISLSLKMKVMDISVTPVQISLDGPSVVFTIGVASKGRGPCGHATSPSTGPTVYIIPKIGFSLSVGSALSLGLDKWGFGIPIPSGVGPDKGGSHGKRNSRGVKNPSQHLSTSTSTDPHPGHPELSLASIDTKTAAKRQNSQFDTFGNSKTSITFSKTLFQKNFALHEPVCLTGGHHQ